MSHALSLLGDPPLRRREGERNEEGREGKIDMEEKREGKREREIEGERET